MIREFQTVADYEGSVPSSQQTDLALVMSTNEVHVNGVNVVVPVPEVGDVVYLDEGNEIVFVSGGTVQKERIPSVWTHVGYVYRVLGNKVGIIDKTVYNEQFQQVEGYLLTGTPPHGYLMLYFQKGNGVKELNVPSSSSLSTLANNINIEIAADTDLAGWQAFASGGAIILQCSTRSECSFIMSHGMTSTKTYSYNPSINDRRVFWRNTSKSLNYGCNLERCVDYYSVHGNNWTYDNDISVPRFVVIVNENTFNENEHLAPAREYYGTYRNYIADSIMIKEQDSTMFTNDFVAYSKQFVDVTAETSGGVAVSVFPAIAKCNQVAYNNALLAAGKWHLPDFRDMVYIADDDIINALASVADKVGTTAFDKNIDRWTLANRLYRGTDGIIEGDASVLLKTAVAQAVVEIEL